MADSKSIAHPYVGIIPIHFDVVGHQLPLDTFLKTTTYTSEVLASFNKQLFDNRLRYELFILPSEPGSFLTKIGFALLGGCAAIWTFTTSDIGKAFVNGLTHHEPAYWAEQLGAELRTLLASPADHSSTMTDAQRLELLPAIKFEPDLTTELTKSFLQTDQKRLENIGIDQYKYKEAYSARNRFYQTLLEYNEIKGLGFTETDNFPLKREDFLRLQIALPPEVLPGPKWRVETTTLTVSSPNWDQDDKKRFWKARDPEGRERYFRIADEYFWLRVKQNKLNPRINDSMKVQWVYDGGSSKAAEVLKVLEYNDQKLGHPLDDEALLAKLGAYDAPASTQTDLFDR